MHYNSSIYMDNIMTLGNMRSYEPILLHTERSLRKAEVAST